MYLSVLNLADMLDLEINLVEINLLIVLKDRRIKIISKIREEKNPLNWGPWDLQSDKEWLV